MSAKLIIACPGRPAINGQRRRKFEWMPEYNAYVYERRVLDEREVNALAEQVVKKNEDLRVFMKVVHFSDEATATIQQTVHTTDSTPVPTTNPDGHVITLEEALNVVQKLAPDRLKKPPGRKAAVEV